MLQNKIFKLDITYLYFNYILTHFLNMQNQTPMGGESKGNDHEVAIRNLQLSGTRILSLGPVNANTAGNRASAGIQVLS